MNDDSASKQVEKIKKSMTELWFQFLGYTSLTGLTQIAALSTQNIAVMLAALISYICLGWWGVDTLGAGCLSYIESRFESIEIESKSKRFVLLLIVTVPILLIAFYVVWALSTALVGAFGINGASATKA